MSDLAPILKWAGGKRQLLSQIIPLVPSDFNRYYEPFVGAGAVLFELHPETAVINDTNTELINVYNVIREHPDELIQVLEDYDARHCKNLYYEIRNLDRDKESFEGMPDLEKAARTIYLNRTCFNGLYRVNKSGFFNTPIGRNSAIRIVNKKGILAIHEYLVNSDIVIMNTDYRKALETVDEGDVVFLDPPYYPTNKNSFLRYDIRYFGVKAQEELRDICDSLTERGIRFVETNSDCDEIRELYSGYNQLEVDVRRCINARSDGRRGKELIISNY